MIGTFLQTLPNILEEMENAANIAAWEKLSRLAHQIKPSFTLMGLDVLRSKLLFIEEQGKSGRQIEELPNVLADFIHRCHTVMNDLSREVEVQ